MRMIILINSKMFSEKRDDTISFFLKLFLRDFRI